MLRLIVLTLCAADVVGELRLRIRLNVQLQGALIGLDRLGQVVAFLRHAFELASNADEAGAARAIAVGQQACLAFRQHVATLLRLLQCVGPTIYIVEPKDEDAREAKEWIWPV